MSGISYSPSLSNLLVRAAAHWPTLKALLELKSIADFTNNPNLHSHSEGLTDGEKQLLVEAAQVQPRNLGELAKELKRLLTE